YHFNFFCHRVARTLDAWMLGANAKAYGNEVMQPLVISTEDAILCKPLLILPCWSIDYLMGEDEPFFSRHFSTSVQSNFVHDELYTLFDEDTLRIWDDMEEGAYHKSDKDGAEMEDYIVLKS
uniref:Uncharacterized protein n=1 Tax=Oryza glaberrima TaxID=4538 RepID=I1PK43_ORYGL